MHNIRSEYARHGSGSADLHREVGTGVKPPGRLLGRVLWSRLVLQIPERPAVARVRGAGREAQGVLGHRRARRVFQPGDLATAPRGNDTGACALDDRAGCI